PGFAVGLATGSKELRDALLLKPTIFEPLHTPTLHAAHNKLSFHTWSDKRCCLASGATSATLAGHFPDLKVGDALLFEEVLGPHTGDPADADPSHRHIVRLTSVKPSTGATLSDPLTGAAIMEIAWGIEDALPFALCISSKTGETHGSQYLAEV